MRSERRTGVVVLSLVLATNGAAWVQFAATFELMPDEPGGLVAAFSLAAGACLLAMAAVIAAWLSARRLPVPPDPRIRRPRDLALGLAIGAAAANLLLAGLVSWLEVSRSVDLRILAWSFGLVWLLAVLPTQTLAAFFTGRASIVPAGVPASH
jgi:hypothetical protein